MTNEQEQRWTDGGVRYLVEVRPPLEGEEFLTGATVRIAEKDYKHTVYPVIIKAVRA
jgi:hypothetical protein